MLADAGSERHGEIGLTLPPNNRTGCSLRADAGDLRGDGLPDAVGDLQFVARKDASGLCCVTRSAVPVHTVVHKHRAQINTARLQIQIPRT